MQSTKLDPSPIRSEVTTMSTTLYTFELKVNDTEQHTFTKTRIQVQTHPEEPQGYTTSRVIAYAHCLSYEPKLSEGWFESKEPSLSSRDSAGEYSLWCHVGDLNRKLLKVTQRLQQVPKVRFYFYEPEQIVNFCNLMRGSKQNWIAPYEFYQLDPTLHERLEEIGLKRRNSWEINIIEDMIYLAIDDVVLDAELAPLNMWHIYQEIVQQQEAEESFL
jgi:uncharacterized protein YaeQ